jgi:nucleoid DNA-binding protein
MAKTKKEIIQILATKHNLSLSKVEDIINYQFTYVAKIMKRGDFESIRLPKFGKFSVRPGRIKYIQRQSDGSTDDK